MLEILLRFLQPFLHFLGMWRSSWHNHQNALKDIFMQGEKVFVDLVERFYRVTLDVLGHTPLDKFFFVAVQIK